MKGRLKRLLEARRSDQVALATLVLLGAILRAGLLARAPAFITNDSLSYLLPGFDLATGLGFDPIFKRPPGYPLFVGGALWLFGQQSLLGLLAAQHLLGLLTVALTYLLGRALWGQAAGWLAGSLAAISGPLIVTEHYIMSETLFGCLLTAALLSAAYGMERRSLAWMASSGFLLGLAALCRPVAQLLAPLFALLPLAAWSNRRQALGAGLVVVACYGLIVAPWMTRNALVQGSFTLAGGLGEGLAVRTIRLDQEFDFRAPADRPDLLRTERAIYREEARQKSVFELARRLREEADLSPAAADQAMRDIALGAIRQRPGYYALGSWEMFLKMFAGRPLRLREDWEPWRGIAWETRVDHLLPAARPEQEREFEQVQELVTLFDPARVPFIVGVLFLCGIVAAVRRVRQSAAAVLPPLTALSLLLVSAFLVGIEWRYRYPLDPLIDVTVAGGLASLLRLARHLVGGRTAVGLTGARTGAEANAGS
jgi:Dolichyl-phosphate-mannose-protein mannosyltransferase